MNELYLKIYEAVRMIPKGKVTTYGMIGELVGNKKLARVVGNALHQNPDGDYTPCYRVLNSKGELADKFVFGGADVQQRRLQNDGIEVKNGRVDLSVYGWFPDIPENG